LIEVMSFFVARFGLQGAVSMRQAWVMGALLPSDARDYVPMMPLLQTPADGAQLITSRYVTYTSDLQS
jgi:hypothetical protein